MLPVVMLMGSLQLEDSNFEGVTRRTFVVVGYRFPLGPVFLDEVFWPVREIDREKYIAGETGDT